MRRTKRAFNYSKIKIPKTLTNWSACLWKSKFFARPFKKWRSFSTRQSINDWTLNYSLASKRVQYKVQYSDQSCKNEIEKSYLHPICPVFRWKPHRKVGLSMQYSVHQKVVETNLPSKRSWNQYSDQNDTEKSVQYSVHQRSWIGAQYSDPTVRVCWS